MMLYIISPRYSWFAHQLERHEAQSEQRGATWSSAPEPPAAPGPTLPARAGTGASEEPNEEPAHTDGSQGFVWACALMAGATQVKLTAN